MKQPITLYLELEPGAKPDLATVARAALAFDATVREILFVFDPSLSIRLEFDSGTEGSLKLNSLINTLKEKATNPQVLWAVAFTVLGWIASDVRAYFSAKAIEEVIREESSGRLSDDEIRQIAEEVAKALRGRVGEEQVKKVYEELQRDETIRGVGITTNPDKKPRIIVPRAEFKTRSQSSVTPEDSTETRQSVSTEKLTLISPVLLAVDRRWRFSLNGFEFGAAIKDQDFLERLLSGREALPMVAGLTMDVVLEGKEEKIGGVWTVKERSITRVLKTHPAPTQGNFDLPAKS